MQFSLIWMRVFCDLFVVKNEQSRDVKIHVKLGVCMESVVVIYGLVAGDSVTFYFVY